MDRQTSATATLRQEHRLILRVVDALERILDGSGPADPPLEDLGDCVTFFRSYADACHHGKEEDLLFEELEDRGMSREGGPIAVMLHEHRLGRQFVGEMRDALRTMGRGDAEAWNRLERAGRGYIDLMRGHIGKEDGVLFEMADRMVAGPACRRLCTRYEEVCSRRFDGRTKADLETLASSLARRTAGMDGAGSGPSPGSV